MKTFVLGIHNFDNERFPGMGRGKSKGLQWHQITELKKAFDTTQYGFIFTQ